MAYIIQTPVASFHRDFQSSQLDSPSGDREEAIMRGQMWLTGRKDNDGETHHLLGRTWRDDAHEPGKLYTLIRIVPAESDQDTPVTKNPLLLRRSIPILQRLNCRARQDCFHVET